MSPYNEKARKQADNTAFGSRYPPQDGWNLNQPPGSVPSTNQSKTSDARFEPVDASLGTSILPTKWKYRGPPAAKSAFGVLSFNGSRPTSDSMFAEQLTIDSYSQGSEPPAPKPKRRKRASPPVSAQSTTPDQRASMMQKSGYEKQTDPTSAATAEPTTQSTAVEKIHEADEYDAWVEKMGQKRFEIAATAHRRR